ncbi:dihydroorotate dehydrogenase (quinone), mitochondrial-like [Actinia tenebrosa]|uniref:Dihydroorotate dehydrogenase (quinone), mitochondrial n=1 Tax=Actinia tenebrosa TaxID=6105 RepID=A0A6P8IYM0_ACTTE|nr:dihydroorotate dehydrogenase (quinone), mitochondrial-like [Actinia tenebrosa]
MLVKLFEIKKVKNLKINWQKPLKIFQKTMSSFKSKVLRSIFRHGIALVGCTSALFCGYFTVKGDEQFYRNVIMPVIKLLDAERAHLLAVKMASYGLVPSDRDEDPEILNTKVFGLQFSNPVGLAAGFDKQGEAVSGLVKMGFGFVEIGSITPEPQPGNQKPRVFRLNEDKAIINRYGFNSQGHEIVKQNLHRHRVKLNQGILGINLGKNKTSEDAVLDYTKGVEVFGPMADYLVINVSSPNTPGLRAMQGREMLAALIDKVLEARSSLPPSNQPPLLVKIAPDLTQQDKEDIAAVVTRPNHHIDGIIVSNTTISRPPSLQSANKKETGGLSGEPLRTMSTELVRDMYTLTKGTIPIIGVGGISSGQDAYDKIKAGASLVQLYTALTYHGPPLVKRLKKELADLLRKDGFNSVSEAVGVDHKDHKPSV